MTRHPRARRLVCAIGLALSAGLIGCASLIPKPPVLPAFYTLDGPRGEMADVPVSGTPSRPGPTVAVQRPQAAAGYDSARIVYTREAQRLEAFANSEWVDTPSRMLAPLIVAAVERSGAARAVVIAPTEVATDIGLDTDIVRLQHDFSVTPSVVRFTLRATWVDSRTRKVLAIREFDESAPSASEDPRGGVMAARQAVAAVLTRVSALGGQVAQQWANSQNPMPNAAALK